MIDAQTLPPPVAAEPSEPEDAGRPPLRELLPQGAAAVGVVTLGVALAAISFIDFGASGRALVGAVLCPALVLLAAIDLRHRLLPNTIVMPSALAVTLIVAAADPHGLLEHVEAGLALGAFFFVFAAIFPAGLGMGDAKVGLLIGLALGVRTLSAMLAASFAVFLVALWVLFRHGLSARKQSIPFGPFLALGGIVGFFLG